MLTDPEKGVAYIPVSLDLLKEFRDWSEPVRVRLEYGELVFQKLGQPVQGVYIADNEFNSPTPSKEDTLCGVT